MNNYNLSLNQIAVQADTNPRERNVYTMFTLLPSVKDAVLHMFNPFYLTRRPLARESYGACNSVDFAFLSMTQLYDGIYQYLSNLSKDHKVVVQDSNTVVAVLNKLDWFLSESEEPADFSKLSIALSCIVTGIDGRVLVNARTTNIGQFHKMYQMQLDALDDDFSKTCIFAITFELA